MALKRIYRVPKLGVIFLFYTFKKCFSLTKFHIDYTITRCIGTVSMNAQDGRHSMSTGVL